MVHKIFAKNIIKPGSECHYAVNTPSEALQSAQVYDFYEIILIIKGCVLFEINGQKTPLEKGSLLFVRPGDIHSKISQQSCQYISLAVPVSTVESLFEYLYAKEETERFLNIENPIPESRLNNTNIALVQEKLARLNFLPDDSQGHARTAIRKFLMEIVSEHFMPAPYTINNKALRPNPPAWLGRVIEELDNHENLALGMDFISESSNRTNEHICRAFKKYMHTTPTTYINTKRLGYAADMLTYTDKSITDIIYEVGFYSVSHFYSLFRKEFGLTPRKYRDLAPEELYLAGRKLIC